MPIIHFEYTNNLAIDKKINAFLKETHHTLVDMIKTDLFTCRSTITCHQHYLIADGNPRHAFIQLSIRMLPGRSKETKDKLGHQLLTMIKQMFGETMAQHETQLRVYLTEIEANYYYGL
jgi:5-carboxymethyl-2-hydroxymuconate isomerase